jgi:hypothetical protein
MRCIVSPSIGPTCTGALPGRFCCVDLSSGELAAAIDEVCECAAPLTARGIPVGVVERGLLALGAGLLLLGASFDARARGGLPLRLRALDCTVLCLFPPFASLLLALFCADDVVFGGVVLSVSVGKAPDAPFVVVLVGAGCICWSICRCNCSFVSVAPSTGCCCRWFAAAGALFDLCDLCDLLPDSKLSTLSASEM